jgi:hypothetical protein
LRSLRAVAALSASTRPKPARLGLPDDVEGLRAFCERMVEVCAPLVAVVKPQAAFSSGTGWPEWKSCDRRSGGPERGVGHHRRCGGHFHDGRRSADAPRERSLFGGDVMPPSAYLGLDR